MSVWHGQRGMKALPDLKEQVRRWEQLRFGFEADFCNYSG